MSFVPPFVLEHACGSADDYQEADKARTQLSIMQQVNKNMTYSGLKTLGRKGVSTKPGKNRLVYTMNTRTRFDDLPGEFLFGEDGPSQGADEDVEAIYKNAGIVYDFYEYLGYNSLDDHGMDLISVAHFGRQYNNAFWSDGKMVYGDGNGKAFTSLHKALDVAGHEMTHGLIDYSCRLVYKGESGALNESLADVYGVTIEQWHRGETADKTNWLMGDEIIGPGSTAKALRSFTTEPAFVKDPIFGTDDQPKHMKDYVQTKEDNGGVHINSGIPNHAYYLVATRLGGGSWEKAIKIWDYARVRLWFWMGFGDLASRTVKGARKLYGEDTAETVRQCWAEVGIRV